MKLWEKLEELGYECCHLNTWVKSYHADKKITTFIFLKRRQQIVGAQIYIPGIESQKDIDDVQIAFNRLQEDLKKLQEFGLVIEEVKE